MLSERPRDASCLSVVSFNSTIRRAQSSIIAYFGFRFTAAYNEIVFCSLLFFSAYSLMRGGVCHKQPCAVTVIQFPCSSTEDRQLLITHCSCCRSDSKIFVENRDFRLPHLHSTPPPRSRGGGSGRRNCHNVWYWKN